MAPSNIAGERIAMLEVSVKDNSNKLDDLSRDVTIKHGENRAAIHELRNGQQKILTQMALAQLEIQEKMHTRDVALVKTQAKWAGMATATAFILTLLAPFAQEALKHILGR